VPKPPLPSGATILYFPRFWPLKSNGVTDPQYIGLFGGSVVRWFGSSVVREFGSRESGGGVSGGEGALGRPED
jgi:hypothetical protein